MIKFSDLKKGDTVWFTAVRFNFKTNRFKAKILPVKLKIINKGEDFVDVDNSNLIQGWYIPSRYYESPRVSGAYYDNMPIGYESHLAENEEECIKLYNNNLKEIVEASFNIHKNVESLVLKSII